MSFFCSRTLFALCALAWMVFPATAEPPPKPNDRQVAQWIKELGADDFVVREKASRQLWLAGPVAEAALEKALQTKDAEVFRRARDILDKFRWGIYPDTPPDVVALIRTYQSSSDDARPQDLDKLLQSGSAGLRAVLQFAQSQKQRDQREALVKRVAHKLPAAFQRALTHDDDWERFDAVIVLAYDRKCVSDNHYVAYWLLRDKLQERIAQFRTLTANNPSERRFAQTLAYLYRAAGDRNRACAAAEMAKRSDLLLALLIEAGDWKTLAARPHALEAKSTSEKWGYRLAFARLAGNRKDLESAVGEVLQQATKERNWSPTLRVAKTFLLNDRPDEALALLAKSPDHQTDLFELLCARKQYGEALALADQPRPADSNEQHYLDLLKARTLYQLGEKERARALFVQFGKRIKEGVKGFWAERLLAEEYKVGLKDLAFEHCARIKSVEADWGEVSPAWGVAPYLRQVFPNRSESAKIWWDLLRRKFPDDSAASTLKRLRDLLEGKTEARTVKQWIAEVERGTCVRGFLRLAVIEETGEKVLRRRLLPLESCRPAILTGKRWPTRAWRRASTIWPVYC